MSSPAATTKWSETRTATLVRPYVFSAPVKHRIRVDCARKGCTWTHSFNASLIAGGDIYDHLREHSNDHAAP